MGMQEDRYTGITNYQSINRIPAGSAYRISTESNKIPVNFEDIRNTGVMVDIKKGDEYSDNIDLGFDFDLYDGTFNSFKIGGCGLITFDDCQVGQPCPVNYSPNKIAWDAEVRSWFGFSDPYTIFANWTSLRNGLEGKIHYQVLDGGLESERMVIQWSDVDIQHWDGQSEGLATFQLKIFKDGRVESHVLDNGGINHGPTANEVNSVWDYWNKRLIGSVGSLGEADPNKTLKDDLFDFVLAPHYYNEAHNVYYNDTMLFRDYSYFRENPPFGFIFEPGPPPPNNFAVKIPTTYNRFDPSINTEREPGVAGPVGPTTTFDLSTFPSRCGIGEIVNGEAFIEADWLTENGRIFCEWRYPGTDERPLGQLRVIEKNTGLFPKGFRVRTYDPDIPDFLDTGSEPIPFSWWSVQFEPEEMENNIIATSGRIRKQKRSIVENETNEGFLGPGPPGSVSAVFCEFYYGKNKSGGSDENRRSLSFPDIVNNNSKPFFEITGDWITDETVVICTNEGGWFTNTLFNVIVEPGKFRVWSIAKMNRPLDPFDNWCNWVALNSIN